MLYEKIQADKIIFRINDTADKFYIVLRGSVDVLKSYPLRCNLTIVEYVSYLMKLKLYDENHLLCSTLNNVNNQSLVKLKEMDFIHIQGLYTYAYKIIETIVVEYKCKSFDHLESIFHQFIGFSNRKTTMKLSKLSMSKISLNDLEMRFLNILGTYSTNNLMDASSQLLRNKSRSKSNKHIIRSICTGSDSNILNSLAHSNQDKLDKRRSQHRALIDLNLLSETIKYCLCNEIKNTNYLTKIGVNFDVDIRSRLSSYWEANSDYTGKSNQKFSFNVNEYYKYSTLQTGNYFGDLALESDSSKR